MEKEKEKIKEEGRTNPIRIGISIGDVNGIGPEVVIKSLADNRLLLDCTPIIYASSKTISFHKKALNEPEFNYQTCKTANEAVNRKINIINVWNEEVQFDLGKGTEASGKYAFLSLERATEDLAAGKIDVLVTAPISKEAIGKAGFKFPGHTEYLAHLAGKDEALMVMISGSLRVALVTTHLPLKNVSGSLSREKIVSKIRELDNSLKKDFGIQRPRIAVLGLNPHAGENGKMGTEEAEIITPAINMAKNEDLLAFGPFPADGFFGSMIRSQYDAVLAMYHDQGIAAFKALAFEDGVNYTAGLPIVRTSPDHGTAFDIAGKNEANPQSMRSAVYLAMDIFKTRKFLKEAGANPLQVQESHQRKKSDKQHEIE
ncbi:4-hydroxythreonine-4-phosphate dehydrogenase PdxA [Fluviicola sp.]|jgi:4-hydroxythreonine-4-phosphate dehydrogenase|uniref:4-hydroxythreonine-4-phosphate dehydrogenase PdxA n=1 Tax=Fluviicola sp. TaxID=1917219 RepID=UPI00281E0D71|nr:4-hydroxythreonine-4-phosphate dehydrogenase PdxA [Fluviicola sp.]MDR0802665.1 4-hydroxythreonine-4-phosphate dehydrogenase PdxA [Fluviicola sp.]